MKPYSTMMLCLALAGIVALPFSARAQDASAARGKVLFQAECAACHSAEPGQNGIGPSLYGVYGMAAGKVPGYKFSVAMKTSHVVWTDDTLESFLRSPNALITGTNMPQGGGEMHIGVPNAEDRGNIIAYLRSLRG